MEAEGDTERGRRRKERKGGLSLKFVGCALKCSCSCSTQEICGLHGSNRNVLSPSDNSSGKDQKSRKTETL